MDIVKIVQEKMSQNTYLIIENGTAILIDAGVYLSQIEENLKVFSPKPKLSAVFLTHAHFDHIEELDNIVAKYNCPVYIYEGGKSHLYDESKNLSYLSPNPFKIKTRKNIKTFEDGDVIKFGDIEINCYNTPGHSVDSSCYIIGDNMFTGDTIFRVEVGRTDLYSGDGNMLKISLERIRNDLSENVKTFYAGHGSNFDREQLIYNVDRILGEM